MLSHSGFMMTARMLAFIFVMTGGGMTYSADIAICANINGNLTALRAVLKDIEARKINEIYIVGGMCGIGARNNDCLDVIRNQQGIRCVLGRWDLFFSGQSEFLTSDPDIDWFMTWSKDKVSAENVAWLKSLELVVEQRQWAGVAGRFDEGAASLFVERVTDARKSFDGLYARKKRLGFTGTTGVPVAFFDQNPINYTQDASYEVDDKIGTLVNVGSVGGPKDDNPVSRYVVFNGSMVTHVPVKYDIEQEVGVMNQLGFPKGLQEKLKQGR